MKQEKQLKLKDLYRQSQEVQDQAELSFAVDQGNLQLQADLLATQQSLRQAEKDLMTLMVTKPFSPSNIIAKKYVVDQLKAGLEALEELKELFD